MENCSFYDSEDELQSIQESEDSEDELQGKQKRKERKWHLIGRAYVCRKGGFVHEHLNVRDCNSCVGEDMKRKYLKDKEKQKVRKLKEEKELKKMEIELTLEKRKNEELRSNHEIAETKQKQDHEMTLKKLDMDRHTSSIKFEKEKIKTENIKADNVKQLIDLLRKNQSTNHGAIENSQSVRPQFHICPSTGSIEITTDNDTVPSAINSFLFN